MSPAMAGGFFTPGTTWEALKLPYDPGIPLLGLYPEKVIIQKDTCARNVHCSTLFTRAKTWKLPQDILIPTLEVTRISNKSY